MDVIAAFENNDKAAHAVSSYLKEEGESYHRFVLRPFNRFDTAFTEWWLIPDSEWPSYKHSKLCFHQYPRSSDGLLYVGFYVEKGLGRQLVNLPDVRANHIMQKDWYWNEFTSITTQIFIEDACHRIVQITQAQLRFLVEIHEFNKVPEVDTNLREPYDSIEFELQFPTKKWKLLSPGMRLLADVKGETVGEITNCINQTGDLNFFWLDLVIGVPMKYGTGLSGEWNGKEIWHKMLKPWLSWVK